MTKYTQKQLKEMVANGIAIDIRNYNIEEARELEKVEGWLSQVGYASSIYGCNGQLWQGHNTGKLYAIPARTQAIYLF